MSRISDKASGEPRPNLFQFATSELSQDAFLCWILIWLNKPGTPLSIAANKLVSKILAKTAHFEKSSEIIGVDIRRQFCRADVTAVLKISSGANICLVIEDKIFAHETGENQVLRNLANVQMRASEWEPLLDVPDNNFIGVLFRTGFDFDVPRSTSFVTINYADVRKWIDECEDQKINNEIFCDWAEWFGHGYLEIDTCISQLNTDIENIARGNVGFDLDPVNYDSRWKDPLFQYLFLKRAFGIHSSDILEVNENGGFRNIYLRSHYDSGRKEYLLQGTSSGRPWIQYHFDAQHDQWFYRLDWQAGAWGLSLRFYKENKTNEDLNYMASVASSLEVMLKKREIFTSGFRRADRKTESTALLIRLAESRGLLNLKDAHAEFVRVFDAPSL